jgi:defect-in-organelle-trafficking protein DotB
MENQEMTTSLPDAEVKASPAAATPPAVAEELPERFVLPAGYDRNDIEQMLIRAVNMGCSDIRIQTGDYVTVYWKRNWYCFTNRSLENDEVEKALRFMAGPTAVSEVMGGKEVDMAPEFFSDVQERTRMRFRLNAISARVGMVDNGITLILRAIPTQLPEFKRQGLQVRLAADLLPFRGLVLIAGATGSGKSTLITACLHQHRQRFPGPAILTYEDPPEADHGRDGLGKVPLVSQVHVGKNIKGWERAAPTAMRRKGDIILMGEVRDRDSAESTMEMAITGHGVYATIHADTPNETIARLVGMFPDESRSDAAMKLLSSLRLICAQKLVLLLDGRIVPLRSWISFDTKIKEMLSSPDITYPYWAAWVSQYLKLNKQDFASACEPYIKDGSMDLPMFREITLMGHAEAEAYFDKVWNDVTDINPDDIEQKLPGAISAGIEDARVVKLLEKVDSLTNQVAYLTGVVETLQKAA